MRTTSICTLQTCNIFSTFWQLIFKGSTLFTFLFYNKGNHSYNSIFVQVSGKVKWFALLYCIKKDASHKMAIVGESCNIDAHAKIPAIFNPHQTEVSESLIRRRGGQMAPPRYRPNNGFCKFCFYRGLDTYIKG